MASAACCRKDDEPDRESTSMGIWRRCAAKMVFMNGMYCAGEAAETESTRIREARGTGALREEVMAPVVELVGVRSTVCLLV